MKKKILLSSLFSLAAAGIFAGEISLQQAELVAKRVYTERLFAFNGGGGPVQFSSHHLFERGNTPLIYLFNVEGEKGFVMIAAQDNVQPVLAYSFEGNYKEAEEQPAFADWTTNYMDQIAFCLDKSLPSTPAIDRQWNMFLGKNAVSASSLANVGPLMSTKWNQGCYYNEQCPTISTGGQCSRAWTGCGATAMAQMMKYHNHPSGGTGSNSYTWMSQTLSASFASAVYNYSSMPNSVSSSNSAVAQLLSHAGIALNMNYGGSGSYCFFDMGTVMPKYFKYAPVAQSWSKLFVTNDTVYQMRIAAELDSLRPVFYKGSGSNGQHFFLVDGYQNSYPYYFHVNWGWGGLYDGYYYCSALNPGSYSFTSGQGAIIRVMPQSITTGTNENKGFSSLRLYPNPANDKLTIDPGNEEINAVSIFNTLGEEVFVNHELLTPTYKLEIKDLREGLYLVEVQSANRKSVSRLVVSR